MKCANIQGILVDYSDGSLGDGAMRALEKHLSGCEACRAELGRIEKLKESVRSLGAPERDAEFWSRFDKKLSLRLDEVETGGRRSARRAWLPLAAAAGVAALAVASLMMFGESDYEGVAPGVKVAVEAPEAVEVPAIFEVDEVEFAMSGLESLDDEMLDELLLAQADSSNGYVDQDGDDMLSLIEEDLLAALEEMVLDGFDDESIDDYLEDMSEEELEEVYVSLASI
jgi:anti-sigma factor RsiW